MRLFDIRILTPGQKNSLVNFLRSRNPIKDFHLWTDDHLIEFSFSQTPGKYIITKRKKGTFFGTETATVSKTTLEIVLTETVLAMLFDDQMEDLFFDDLKPFVDYSDDYFQRLKRRHKNGCPFEQYEIRMKIYKHIGVNFDIITMYFDNLYVERKGFDLKEHGLCDIFQGPLLVYRGAVKGLSVVPHSEFLRAYQTIYTAKKTKKVLEKSLEVFDVEPKKKRKM